MPNYLADYGGMAHRLMGLLRPNALAPARSNDLTNYLLQVGDVVPFRRTMPKQTGEIVGPYMGGGGRRQLDRELERGEITKQQYEQIRAVRQAVDELNHPSRKIWDQMSDAAKYDAARRGLKPPPPKDY